MVGNTNDGLFGVTHGSIKISKLTASWNGGEGAFLVADSLTSPQNVTLTGTNTFIGNGATGLTVLADGQITISNLAASNNGGYGAYLDNYTNWKSGTPGITLTGTNTFNDNGDDGLYFDSMGPVTLSKVTADGNSDNGVYGLSSDKITILSGSMTSNGCYGWYLWTPSVATLKGVFAYGNGTNGYLDGGGTLIIKRL